MGTSGGADGGGGGALAYRQSFLAADVAMTPTGSFVDGPAVNLTPGTWLLSGAVSILGVGTGARTWTAQLWDGVSAPLSSSAFAVTGTAAAGQASLPVQGIVTVAAATTYKVSGKSTAAGESIKALGGLGSYLVAVKIA